MIKRLLILNGIAALTVVINHTALYGLNAMLFWRYGKEAEPSFEAVGTLPYNILFIIHHLAVFAIPAFLFVSGYFMAFTAKTSVGITWEYVIPRIKKLIVPFLGWSIIVHVFLLGRFPPTVDEVLELYYYIPLVVQYYLLSPLIIRLAQKRWLLLLVVSAVLQFSAEIIALIKLLGIDNPVFYPFFMISRVWLFPGRILYFSIGVVAGLYQQQFFYWIKKLRWVIFVVMLIFIALSLLEYTWVSMSTGVPWLPNYRGVFRIFFSIALVFCYIAFDNLKFPRNELSELGGKSLGIYLVHTPALYASASLMFYLTHWALNYQILYQAILIATGLGIPLLLMAAFRKPLVRKVYPLIFG